MKKTSWNLNLIFCPLLQHREDWGDRGKKMTTKNWTPAMEVDKKNCMDVKDFGKLPEISKEDAIAADMELLWVGVLL